MRGGFSALIKASFLQSIYCIIHNNGKTPSPHKNPELQISDEVRDAVEKQERVEQEKVPNDPSERIEASMDRLENIFLNPDERVREGNLEMFRDKIYEALLIKKENFLNRILNANNVLLVNVGRR